MKKFKFLKSFVACLVMSCSFAINQVNADLGSIGAEAINLDTQQRSEVAKVLNAKETDQIKCFNLTKLLTADVGKWKNVNAILVELREIFEKTNAFALRKEIIFGPVCKLACVTYSNKTTFSFIDFDQNKQTLLGATFSQYLMNQACKKNNESQPIISVAYVDKTENTGSAACPKAGNFESDYHEGEFIIIDGCRIKLN